MNYADIKVADVANGTGVRVSLFVSGCNHHCKGCFNPEAWNFNYGKEFTEEETEKIYKELDILIGTLRTHDISIEEMFTELMMSIDENSEPEGEKFIDLLKK